MDKAIASEIIKWSPKCGKEKKETMFRDFNFKLGSLFIFTKKKITRFFEIYPTVL